MVKKIERQKAQAAELIKTGSEKAYEVSVRLYMYLKMSMREKQKSQKTEYDFLTYILAVSPQLTV